MESSFGVDLRDDLSVAVVGFGGYGKVYIQTLLRGDLSHGLKLVAAIDPAADRFEQVEQIRRRGVAVFHSLDAFWAEGNADLILLATPPQFHCEQVVAALEHGCHVLCEKPTASSPDQVQQMIRARDRAGKIVAIGYQWSFSPAIQHLKKDIANGRFGRAKRLTTSVYWPRDERYYARNNWAGRQKDAQGRLVLDSPVNNACAHYLHNMFYVLGDQLDRSAMPRSVQAELYRAIPIENYDTAAIRCQTNTGAELLFITTHVSERSEGPILHYEFEKGSIRHSPEEGGALIARFNDGSRFSYGAPLDSNSMEKLFDVCNAIRSGTPVACGLEASGAHTACMFAAQQSMPMITQFPEEVVRVKGEAGSRKTSVIGLEDALNRCISEFRLPNELGFPWSRPGKLVTVEDKITRVPSSDVV